MDFRVRSLHRNLAEVGDGLPLPCGWSDSTEGGLEGASSWEGVMDAGSLLCPAPSISFPLQSWNFSDAPTG